MVIREKLITIDPWLEPHADEIDSRIAYTDAYRKRILGDMSLSDFAVGYLYFGLNKTESGWVFREWAPGATKI